MTGLEPVYPASPAEPADGSAECPVCRYPAGPQVARCGVCGWELLGGYVAGEAGQQERQVVARRLAAARRDLDLRAAVRSVSHGTDRDASRLAWLCRLIRGGEPSRDQVDQMIAEVAAAEQAVPSSAAGTGFALARLVAGQIDALAFLEIGPDGMAAEVLVADELGVPRRYGVPESLRWQALIPHLSSDRDLRRFQLAGGVGSAGAEQDRHHRGVLTAAPTAGAGTEDAMRRAFAAIVAAVHSVVPLARFAPGAGNGHLVPRLDVILVRRTSGWAVLDTAARQARLALRPITEVFQSPDAGPLATVVEHLAGRAPLRYSYELALVEVDGRDSGQYATVRLEPFELFPAGTVAISRGGPEISVVVSPPAHAAEELLLPIVARRGDEPAKWPLIESLAISGTRTGPTSLLVRLHAPGRLGATAEPDAQPPRAGLPGWPGLLRDLPRQLRRTLSLDLAFLIELCGEKEAVARRMDLARGVIDDLQAHAARPADIRIAVVGYRDHFGPHYGGAVDEEDRLVVTYGLRSIDSAVSVLVAEDVWQAVPRLNDSAAPIEDALEALVTEAGSWRPGARHLLFIVGSRPPHPRKPDEHGYGPAPCPQRKDWTEQLDVLRNRHGVETVAVVDGRLPRRARRFADQSWDDLGRDGRFSLGTTTREQLVRSVGITDDGSAARISLATRGGAPRGNRPSSRSSLLAGPKTRSPRRPAPSTIPAFWSAGAQLTRAVAVQALPPPRARNSRRKTSSTKPWRRRRPRRQRSRRTTRASTRQSTRGYGP
jgi:hypothetical protein